MTNNLDGQQSQWETAFSEDTEMFGGSPSEPAKRAVEFFKVNGVRQIIELGGGQGRDTIYFAKSGFNVSVLEYTDTGIESIKAKANSAGVPNLIHAIKHDVRRPLPFHAETFDACFSHMLYCMAFTTQELQSLSEEIRRVLKPGGFNIYTGRNTSDAHYGVGIPRGEDMYEVNGFIVHYLSREKISMLAKGYSVVGIAEFEEGELPRKLCEVTYKKV
jgi:SAM-dependent methyltransferase